MKIVKKKLAGFATLLLVCFIALGCTAKAEAEASAEVKELVEAFKAGNATIDDLDAALINNAAEGGTAGSIKALASAGADVNAQDKDGATALMYAAGFGHTEIVDALKAAGAK